MPVIGQPIHRIDALGKVTGETLYPGDINLPDQIYMKILFARRPHAIIRSIDTSEADALPEVVATFTAKDVPVNEYGLIYNDQPVLCGPGSGKPFTDRVRFIGDQVALVVAETEEIAAAGRDLIKVQYEDLPVLTDMEKAMQEDALLLHPDRGSNIFCHYRIRKGNIEDGFSKADVIVEGEYHTPSQEHAFLQPEAGVGYIDEEGRVTVQVAGQWTHEDQQQIAHALNIPVENVRVIYPAIGGAFGGREDMSVQIVLALAAWRLHQRGINRPIKIIWTREESIIGHHKRHPYILRSRWGASKEGKLLAAEVEVIADGGAYVYTSTKVLGNATLMCTGPYEIPNVKVDSYAVYTNNLPNGAFRGFGGPQGAFAAETQMNRLAEKLEMDRIELRRRNVLTEGSLLTVGTPLPKGVTIGKVVNKCGEEVKQSQIAHQLSTNPNLLRGTGFACAFKNVGFSFGAPEQSMATVEIRGGGEIEEVILHHAGADVGQGAHTIMVQVAAETLGIPTSRIHLIASDTAVTGDSGSASASRMTFMAGNSIKGACKLALEKWKAEERPAIATYQYRPPPTTMYDPQTGKSEPNFAYGYVAQSVTLEVDVETGLIHILEVISVNDVGRAVNPLNVQGQIEGGVVQASGYAILENFIQKDGYVLTPLLSTYLIPTVDDIPDQVKPVIVEYADPIGPYGARGMAEMPFLPIVAAVVDAMHQATGDWFYEFPLTPERVLRGMGRL
jgi:CO/xanthine dehydrogenase Mo-binding subunit